MIISPTCLKKLKLNTINSFENHNSIGKIKGYYKDKLFFEINKFTTKNY